MTSEEFYDDELFTDSDPSHIDIHFEHLDGTFETACTCGWQSDICLSYEDADDALHDHLECSGALHDHKPSYTAYRMGCRHPDCCQIMRDYWSKYRARKRAEREAEEAATV